MFFDHFGKLEIIKMVICQEYIDRTFFFDCFLDRPKLPICDFFVQVLKIFETLIVFGKTKHFPQHQACACMNGEFRLLKIVFSVKF